jgi:hypothetical protein
MTPGRPGPRRAAQALVAMAAVVTLASSCGGTPEPTVKAAEHHLSVSYGGVSIMVPSAWRVANRQPPICGASPEERTVYAWKERPGPYPSCSGRRTSVSYVSLACPLSSNQEPSSTSTTVLGGLKAMVEDEGVPRARPSGTISVWLPPGYPYLDVHVPLDPQLAQQIALSLRAGPGVC